MALMGNQINGNLQGFDKIIVRIMEI